MHGLEDNTKMDLEEIQFKDMDFVVGSFEHDNELSSSVKDEGFPGWLSNYELQKESLTWS
jgi:hypothetical protein